MEVKVSLTATSVREKWNYDKVEIVENQVSA